MDPINAILLEGVQTKVFPGGVLLVRHQGKPRVHQAVGLTSSLPNAPTVHLDAIYDLASLTKPLATASAILLLVQDRVLDLEQPLCTVLRKTDGSALGNATIQEILGHRAGLPAWRPFFESFTPTFPLTTESRRERILKFQEMILKEPIDRSSIPKTVYSDLGYILLGFVVEYLMNQSLSEFCQRRIFGPLQAFPLTYHGSLESEEMEVSVPTEHDRWRGKLLHGTVHDGNAAALGGIAGHAGLFGTAKAVGQVTNAWLKSYLGTTGMFDMQLARLFVRASPGTTWGLGWDTPSHPSSSGKGFSAESFGHLGFTGTSIWIDPTRELEVIFLSNRVHPTRENQAIKDFRPRLHDIVIQELFGNS